MKLYVAKVWVLNFKQFKSSILPVMMPLAFLHPILAAKKEMITAVSWIPKGAPKVMPDDAEPHSKEKINELSRMAPSRKGEFFCISCLYYTFSINHPLICGYMDSICYLSDIDEDGNGMECEIHNAGTDKLSFTSIASFMVWMRTRFSRLSVCPFVVLGVISHTATPSEEIARMIKQKLVETAHSSLSGAVPDFDGRKNIYSPVEFQEDRLELFAYLPISSCNTLIKCLTCVRSYLRR
ncbi:hypothetical protein Bca4012_023240 [Brassica carinata]|uniref:Uncharacterized protein n=1 Tax=Brassica carinata TaxID=52824 RepID=A0A8X7TFQ9_BRACI|nr:hypothetical protein Bca52824_090865 [Brassica carinata]